MTQRRRQLTRAGFATGLCVAMLIGEQLVPANLATGLLARIALLVGAAALGTIAIRRGLSAIFGGLDRQAAMLWRNLSTWALYALVGLLFASALGVNLSGLLVGGAILGVVLATVSQASLGNFFSGLILMLSRPYRVGSALRVRGSALGGAEYEGTVLDLSALHTTLVMPGGEILKLPNSAVITSALVVGESPLRAELKVELPRLAPLQPIEAAVRRKLDRPGLIVTLNPESVSVAENSRLVCSVRVRSPQPLEQAEVANAVVEALAGTNEPPAPSLEVGPELRRWPHDR